MCFEYSIFTNDWKSESKLYVNNYYTPNADFFLTNRSNKIANYIKLFLCHW